MKTTSREKTNLAHCFQYYFISNILLYFLANEIHHKDYLRYQWWSYLVEMFTRSGILTVYEYKSSF